MRRITKKYGRSIKFFVESLHTLYCRRMECVEIYDIKGLKSGVFVYPHRFFVEEMHYSPANCTITLKRMEDSGLLVREYIGKTPLVRLNYAHPDIVDAKIIDPYKLKREISASESV